MLPGMTCLSVLVNPDIILFVDFYTTVGPGGSSETIQITNRPGFSKARVTCIGPGGAGVNYYYYDPDTDTEYFDNYGGNGGNAATSILTIGASDSLSALFNDANSYFQIGSSQPVSAATSGQGGTVGNVTYTGGAGIYTSSYSNPGLGGGAAGVLGAGSGLLAGLGVTWKRTSDNQLATNSIRDRDYGGGQSKGYQFTGVRGRGLVVVEWGVDKPF